MNYSYCTAVGVVESFDIEIKTDIKIGIAKISIFSRETDSWDVSAYVAILEDVDQKKAQALSLGDVIFFTGRPTSVDGQSIIFSNNFIILKKNKMNLPMGLCKISALEYARLENIASVSGKVCAVGRDSINLLVKRENYYIRGEITENDYVKVIPTNNIEVNVDDKVICIGKISETGVIGNIGILKE